MGIWLRLKGLLFDPEERKIYFWMLIGPIFMTLATFPFLTQISSTKLVLFGATFTLSWILSIFFALEAKALSHQVVDLKEELFAFEGEVEKLKGKLSSHEEEREEIEKRFFKELDEAKEALITLRRYSEASCRELEKEREQNERNELSIKEYIIEITAFKEKAKQLSQELKVYKASSYTRLDVKHLLDQVNSLRVQLKQSKLVETPPFIDTEPPIKEKANS